MDTTKGQAKKYWAKEKISFSARIEKGLHDRVRDLAFKKQVPFTHILLQALAEYVAKHSKS